ncbi:MULTISPECIES: murein hydrolase activator EnvC family protein [Flammeovirga]|uniref:Peptidoglycan DD-metalloendopeptidase family protein n=1 Tax=Flammeovirga agarivorans TaxID=2726742 RepID=A0A7X8SR79_9BACT|nr:MULTISPECIES: peptidoglycan DD-metalloendopeptidase family protein [Flammeovirga]NLR94793.1 peptidoglycan DD-metalloendopeptidase family protein [Flammeovirga agarivorans]
MLRYVLLLFIFIIHHFAFAQEDIKQAKERIAKMSAILKNTTEQKEASMTELSDIEAHIEGLKHLLEQINKRIVNAQKEGILAAHSVDSLSEKLMFLKEEYAELVYASYKTGGDFEQLAYILASDNFSQFVRRANYIEHYKDIRKKQILEIERTQELLNSKQIEVQERVKEEANSLEEEKLQLAELKKLEEKQGEMIASLKDKEEEIKKQLELERKGLSELQKQMIAMTSKVSSKPETPITKKEETVEVEAVFTEQEGKLSWPVDEGVVTNKFGLRPHPILTGVTIENHGIDIRVKENAKVKSVFSGVVTAVTKVPNLQNVVMIRHGDFFTVYSKLSSVNVKVGDHLPAKKVLGKAGKNMDGAYEVQFQIWNKKGQKLDPEKWLVAHQ